MMDRGRPLATRAVPVVCDPIGPLAKSEKGSRLATLRWAGELTKSRTFLTSPRWKAPTPKRLPSIYT